MPDNKGRGKKSKPSQDELRRRLKEIEEREKAVKERIHKLEVSIVSTPSREIERRLRNWNTLPADEEDVPLRSPRKETRWQRRRRNKARSRQALTALFLLGVLALFLLWFYHQLKNNGVL